MSREEKEESPRNWLKTMINNINVKPFQLFCMNFEGRKNFLFYRRKNFLFYSSEHTTGAKGFHYLLNIYDVLDF